MIEMATELDSQYFDCDLEAFIDVLTKLKDGIYSDYGVKANIEISAYESYESTEVKAQLVFNREETNQEKKEQLDDARIAHRKIVQQEIETLQKLKDKYANFNGDFENYKLGEAQ